MKVSTDSVLFGAWIPLDTFEQNKERDGKIRYLDIGSGSGVITLILAQRLYSLKDFEGYAVEIDKSSYEDSLLSFGESMWRESLVPINKSIQDFIEDRNFYNSFDLVVSNPPYFENSLKPQEKARKIARHSDETLKYDELLRSAKNALKPDGELCIILPSEEMNRFLQLAEVFGFISNHRTELSYKEGKRAVRSLVQLVKKINKISTSKKEILDSLSIQNKSGDFTKEYKDLTKELYLAF